jgi:hypothetical protein
MDCRIKSGNDWIVVIASGAKQFNVQYKQLWIASSLALLAMMDERPRSPKKIRKAQKALIHSYNLAFCESLNRVKRTRACAERESRHATPRLVCINRKTFDIAVRI